MDQMDQKCLKMDQKWTKNASKMHQNKVKMNQDGEKMGLSQSKMDNNGQSGCKSALEMLQKQQKCSNNSKYAPRPIRSDRFLLKSNW